MFSEESLGQYPAVVKAFTGIPSENFWEMVKAMGQQAEAYERERHERAGRQDEQSLVVRAGLVLTNLRLHVPQAAVALLYGWQQRDVSCELRRTLPLISHVLPVPQGWPLSETLAEDVVDVLPLERLSAGRVLVDATPQRVSRPTAPAVGDAHYSGKRKSFTLKTQVVSDGQHHIPAISLAVAGRIHDKTLAQDADTLQRLPDGCEALLDKAYQGLALQVDCVIDDTRAAVPCFTLKTPFKKPMGKDLSAQKRPLTLI